MFTAEVGRRRGAPRAERGRHARAASWLLVATALIAWGGLCERRALAWPTVYPSGTTLYEPQRALAGYTLFSPVVPFKPKLPRYRLYLINMTGALVHYWDLRFPPLEAQLLPNGHVV